MAALNFLWLRLQTVGLPSDNPDTSLPLSVGAIITNSRFEPLKAPAYGFVHPTPAHQQQLMANQKIFAAHMESGTLPRAAASSETVHSLEGDLIEMVDEVGGRATLIGEGMTNFLWPTVQQHFPRLASRLEFWTYDTSSVRRFITTFLPDVGDRILDVTPERAEKALNSLDSFPEPIRTDLREIINSAANIVDGVLAPPTPY